jgi:hypothetical protein
MHHHYSVTTKSQLVETLDKFGSLLGFSLTSGTWEFLAAQGLLSRIILLDYPHNLGNTFD